MIAKYTATSNRDDLDESYRCSRLSGKKFPTCPRRDPDADRLLAESGRQDAKPAQFIDNTFAAELERSGFIDQLL